MFFLHSLCSVGTSGSNVGEGLSVWMLHGCFSIYVNPFVHYKCMKIPRLINFGKALCIP